MKKRLSNRHLNCTYCLLYSSIRKNSIADTVTERWGETTQNKSGLVGKCEKWNLINKKVIVSSFVLFYYDVIWLLKGFPWWSYQELQSCPRNILVLKSKTKSMWFVCDVTGFCFISRLTKSSWQKAGVAWIAHFVRVVAREVTRHDFCCVTAVTSLTTLTVWILHWDMFHRVAGNASGE